MTNEVKVSIIHNLYKRNPYVNQTVGLNLIALKRAGYSFQYICFNDNGDKLIYNDVQEFEPDIEYIYSEKNYGMKMCSGGWVGALPYIRGEYIHNTGQDDVMTWLFYKRLIEFLDTKPDIYLIFSNAFATDERLKSKRFMINSQVYFDYTRPLEMFKIWFGIDNNFNKVTQSLNGILAPGAIYRKTLHNKIGIPDLETYRGAGDFEYWARALFAECKMFYYPRPLWLYRESSYTAGNELIDGQPNRGYWQQQYIQAIKEKYTRLWDLKYGSKE